MQYTPTIKELRILADYWMGQRFMIDEVSESNERMAFAFQVTGTFPPSFSAERQEIEERLTLLRKALGPEEFARLYDTFHNRVTLAN